MRKDALKTMNAILDCIQRANGVSFGEILEYVGSVTPVTLSNHLNALQKLGCISKGAIYSLRPMSVTGFTKGYFFESDYQTPKSKTITNK